MGTAGQTVWQGVGDEAIDMENVVNLTVTHVEAEVVQAEGVSDAEGTNVSVDELL